MNTPAHIAFNLVIMGQTDQSEAIAPVIVGAILPDFSMFVFYFIEKVILRHPESVIWSESYYQPHWQTLSAFSNSIPLGVLALGLLLWRKSKFGMLLVASILLHQLMDLPLHSDDAHRHFFPITNWKFHSPISYWDPNNYGQIVFALEFLGVIISCTFLFLRYKSWGGKLLAGLILSIYLGYGLYVFWVWV